MSACTAHANYLARRNITNSIVAVLEAFETLPEEEKRVLTVEFLRCPSTTNYSLTKRPPALLTKYSHRSFLTLALL